MVVGLLVAMLLIDKVGRLKDSPDKTTPTVATATSDTVVKYIVHHYERDDRTPAQNIDSLLSDSSELENYSVDYLLDNDVENETMESDKTNIAEPKIIDQREITVVFLDNDKNIMETPENVMKSVDIQLWSTPIKNKMSYSFEKKYLKIKGLQSADNLKIYFYKDHYYLQTEKRTYLLNPCKEYTRLSEAPNISFP